MLPPSATAGLAVSDSVVVSTVSVTAVTAAVVSTSRSSKPPPIAEAIVADTLPASTVASSAGAGTLTLLLLEPAAMTMVAPLLSVTVTADAAALVSDAVYTMLPPSATDGVAVSDKVVVSIVSVIVVVAAAGLTASASKPPPLVPLIVADTLPASTITSSLGAATLTVPLVAPAAMPIVAPLLSVTVTALAAGLVNVAV